MTRTIRKRLLQSVISLVVLTLLVFFMARLTGDPSVHYLPMDATPEMRHEFAVRHGLTQPVLLQFAHYLFDLLHLDLGESLRQTRPALNIVLEAFPTTLWLAFLTISISLAVAIVAGAIAAWQRGGFVDRLINVIALIGASAPNFWIAIVGILVFAVWFRVLPTSGTGSPQHWILPVVVMVLRPAGLFAQVVRSSMVGTLASDYIRTARAKGAAPPRILFIHALRNAVLPLITVAGDQAATIVNGAVIVETIFSLPGIGKVTMDSITYRDFAVVQAVVLVTATAIFLLNIAIDFIYTVVDPRVRAS